MPTTLPRTNITHLPRVERILAIGRRRWPGKSAKDLLVDLAEERAVEIETGRPVPTADQTPTTYAHFLRAMGDVVIDDEWVADVEDARAFFVETGGDPWGDD